MKYRKWNAHWIAHPATLEYSASDPSGAGERNVYYLFRHEFELNEVPPMAELAISGSSWYRLYLNGEFVEQGPIQSAAYYRYYNRRDVASFLRPGRNTVAVELQINGNTWPGALLFELRGEKDALIVKSSGEWKTTRGTAWRSNTHFFGPSLYVPWQEIFDARRMPQGWRENGFADSTWQDAGVWVDGRGGDTPPAVSPWLHLVERDIPYLLEEGCFPLRIVELSENVHIRSRVRQPEDMSVSLSAVGRAPQLCRFLDQETLCGEDGVCRVSGFGNAGGGEVYDPAILVDFGRVIRAYPELTVEGPAGTRIEIGYAEDLIDGHFNNAIGSVFADSVYLGGEKLTFRPFLWKSFRYMKLRIYGEPPYTVGIHSLRALCERYDFSRSTIFHAEEKRLQQIYEMCANTIDLCTSDNIFDTPCREQGQWTYDICGVILDGLLWGFGETAMCRKYLRQTARSLTPMGTPAIISNSTAPDWRVYTDVGLQFTPAMWEYYQYSGDDSLLYECYGQLLLNLDFFRNFLNSEGLIADMPAVFLDWAYNFSEDARRGISAPVNALFYRLLGVQEAISCLYGDDFRLRQIRADREKLKSAYLKHFWIGERGCLSDSIVKGKRSDAVSEYTHALAILSGLLEGEKLLRVIRGIFETRDSRVLEAEPFACAFVLRALAKAGRFDLALQILRERWGERWAAKGYTSTPENWALFYCNGDVSTLHTHSHAWSAGPCEFLTRHLLGLEMISPGFREIRMNPQTLDCDCKFRLNTPRGEISAEYRNGNWNIQLGKEIKQV